MAESDDIHLAGRCNDVLESMYLYLDGEMLTEEQRTEVHAHLDECIPCLESFEFEAEFKQIIRSKCKDEVPQHVYEKIRARLVVEIDSTSHQQPDA